MSLTETDTVIPRKGLIFPSGDDCQLGLSVSGHMVSFTKRIALRQENI